MQEKEGDREEDGVEPKGKSELVKKVIKTLQKGEELQKNKADVNAMDLDKVDRIIK